MHSKLVHVKIFLSLRVKGLKEGTLKGDSTVFNVKWQVPNVNHMTDSQTFCLGSVCFAVRFSKYLCIICVLLSSFYVSYVYWTVHHSDS